MIASVRLNKVMTMITPARALRFSPAHLPMTSKSRNDLFTRRIGSFGLPAARSYVQAASTPPSTPVSPKTSETLAIPSSARFNELKIQHLSKKLHEQIFFHEPEPPLATVVNISKTHLDHHGLLDKPPATVPPIAFELPKLQGRTLDEHFYRISMDVSEPYLSIATSFAHKALPKHPTKWVRQSGWTKYTPDGNSSYTTEKVSFPDSQMFVFDVEVLYKQSPFAVMACAASPTAWYAWLSPWLLGEVESNRQLIPLGNTAEKVVVGQYIGFDRARIKDEYNLQQSKTAFLDTMSLDIAVVGMKQYQPEPWNQLQLWRGQAETRRLLGAFAINTEWPALASMLQHGMVSEEEKQLWIGRKCKNSLRDLAKSHCGIDLDKTVRDQFGKLDRDGVCKKLDTLLSYCAGDVAVTHKVYRKIFPKFLRLCPHPVSFSALRHLSSAILPTDRSWEKYISTAESVCNDLTEAANDLLIHIVNDALQFKDNKSHWSGDPWLRQLDWSETTVSTPKAEKILNRNPTGFQSPFQSIPKWYKDLFQGPDAEFNFSLRSRIAPLLFRLSWEGNPLVLSKKYGWTFKVRRDMAAKYEGKLAVNCDVDAENPIIPLSVDDEQYVYFKLPHEDGPSGRCTNVFTKYYNQYFENGALRVGSEAGKKIFNMNASRSYWLAVREKVMEQMVVYQSDTDLGAEDVVKEGREELGVILPQLTPMGTSTRRAVDDIWTAPRNANANSVGSELKAMVKAPPGYAFVGAVVDSEELWIASLFGDAQFKLHGGSALGFITLEGTEAAETDLHSKTAKILGISRNNARAFDSSRINGAGMDFATTLLQQFAPNLTPSAAKNLSEKLYAEAKGQLVPKNSHSEDTIWRHGIESFVFNKLQEFVQQEQPRTPVLGARIPEGLWRNNLSKYGFVVSRINWAIQSSVVDYLHLLITGMDYLIHTYGLRARLAITGDSEIRYLAKEEDKYRAAFALQVANLWTRAMFSQQMGINDLPQSCAFFSSVDIDHILRKEVDMDCITPSQKEPIPPGESLDIKRLLGKGEKADLGPPRITLDPDRFPYYRRVPVMEELQNGNKVDIACLSSQVGTVEATNSGFLASFSEL